MSARRFVDIGEDKRELVMIVQRGKVLGHFVSWTHECSGCFEGGEYMGMAHHYGYDKKHQCYIGAGCSECGYTGKRRTVIWLPLPKEIQRKLIFERTKAVDNAKV